MKILLGMLNSEGSKGIDAKYSFYFQELIERVDSFENNSCIRDTLQKENIYNNNRSLKYSVQVQSIVCNIYYHNIVLSFCYSV